MVIGVRRRREGAAGWWAGAQPSGWRAGRSAQWNAGRPSDYAGRGGDRQPDRSSCWWVGGSLLRCRPPRRGPTRCRRHRPGRRWWAQGTVEHPGQGAAVARCSRVSGVSVATSSIRSPGWNATACFLANGGRLRPGGLEGGGSRYSQSTQRMVVCSRWCGRRLWPRRSSRRSPPAPTRRGVTRRRCDPGSRTRCRPRLTAAHKCRGSGVGWDPRACLPPIALRIDGCRVPAGVLVVDTEPAVATGGVQVLQPLVPPGDGPLAAVHRHRCGVGQGGGELAGGDQPAVVGLELV
jgi:hypothetical protein